MQDDSVARYERATERIRRRIDLEDMLQLIPVIISDLVDAVVKEITVVVITS